MPGAHATHRPVGAGRAERMLGHAWVAGGQHAAAWPGMRPGRPPMERRLDQTDRLGRETGLLAQKIGERLAAARG